MAVTFQGPVRLQHGPQCGHSLDVSVPRDFALGAEEQHAGRVHRVGPPALADQPARYRIVHLPPDRKDVLQQGLCGRLPHHPRIQTEERLPQRHHCHAGGVGHTRGRGAANGGLCRGVRPATGVVVAEKQRIPIVGQPPQQPVNGLVGVRHCSTDVILEDQGPLSRWMHHQALQGHAVRQRARHAAEREVVVKVQELPALVDNGVHTQLACRPGPLEGGSVDGKLDEGVVEAQLPPVDRIDSLESLQERAVGSCEQVGETRSAVPAPRKVDEQSAPGRSRAR
mmetsp:Transcript_91613/g.290656  ORF Transcript_91613/g.290656 Transcript_91613/m.290656 type:complete len:282 (+) Transcript_91613:137-982(+)